MSKVMSAIRQKLKPVKAPRGLPTKAGRTKVQAAAMAARAPSGTIPSIRNIKGSLTDAFNRGR